METTRKQYEKEVFGEGQLQEYCRAYDEALEINKKINKIIETNPNCTNTQAYLEATYPRIIRMGKRKKQAIDNCVQIKNRLIPILDNYDCYNEKIEHNLYHLDGNDIIENINNMTVLGETFGTDERVYNITDEEMLANGIFGLGYIPIENKFEIDGIDIGTIEEGYGPDFKNEIKIFKILNAFVNELKKLRLNFDVWIEGGDLTVRFIEGQKLDILKLEKIFKLTQELRKNEILKPIFRKHK